CRSRPNSVRGLATRGSRAGRRSARGFGSDAEGVLLKDGFSVGNNGFDEMVGLEFAKLMKDPKGLGFGIIETTKSQRADQRQQSVACAGIVFLHKQPGCGLADPAIGVCEGSSQVAG